MKLVYDGFGTPLNISDVRPYKIVIESPDLTRELIQDIRYQLTTGEGRLILSNNGKPIKFQNDVELILSPFNIDLNKKKIINRILLEIDKIAVGEDMYLETANFRGNFIEYINRLFEDIECPLTYNEDIKISKILAAVGLSIEDSGNLLANLLQYIDLSNYVLGINVFFIYGLDQIFSEKMLNTFYREISYKHVYLIQLEIQESGDADQFDCTVIDADRCIVRLK